jgi:PHD/YefM family antitoxin component YafN of YafNO toxin-antitoxin module
MEATKIKMQVSLLEAEEMVFLDAADAQIDLPGIVQQVAANDQRVILTLEGKKMAAIISLEAFEFLERMIEKIEDEIDIQEAERILAESKPEDYITLEQLKQELGLD